MQFRNSEESVQQIARKLSVNHIVKSSVRGTEDNLRVEIRLVEAFPEEKYIWSSSFNLPWKELAGMYPEILNRILDGIKVKLTPTGREHDHREKIRRSRAHESLCPR